MFRVSLLAVNHLFIFSIIFSTFDTRVPILSLWQKMPVSSAKIPNKPSIEEFAISFIKIMNNRGPSTEPYWTPHLTVFFSKFALFTLTYCCLSERKL